MIIKNYDGKEIEVPEEPRSIRATGGCKCSWNTSAVGSHWKRNPDCEYHNVAAQQPWNHRIPWNCPTYYDGCNCGGGPYFL